MSTIKDIAKLAGVSPTTVTNVLHKNYARVSKETREKVEKYIEKCNYAPNMGARILGQNDSRIIGVIMFMEPRWNETVLEDPFSSSIIGSIEKELHSLGYYFMLQTTTSQQEVVQLAKTWKLAGLILVWVPKDIAPTILDSVESPVVFIDSYFEDKEKTYYDIGLKDEKGGYLIAQHLISNGHKKAMFFTNDKSFAGTDLNRYKGCKKAFDEANLEFDLDNIIFLSKEKDERYKAYSNVTSKEMPYTALIFSSDYYAAEAISYLHDSGINIPNDISITGYDDNIFSRIVQPHLTTIHQDSDEKGILAVSMLMKLIKKEPIEEKIKKLDVKLIVRDSVKNINK
ncbi:MAG: LacI family DNA-binding transcriptional regulator [Pleomorphochaeta sp.]